MQTLTIRPAALSDNAAITRIYADAVRNGGSTISNDPSFFFYLTYALKPQASNSGWRFTGSLPEHAAYPQVWSASQWQGAGQPLPPAVK